jgi:hypothetical protein
VAKIHRLFRSIMTTAVEDGLIARNPVRIKGSSAERMIERPLLRWDDVRALAGAIHPRFECLVWRPPRAACVSASSPASPSSTSISNAGSCE